MKFSRIALLLVGLGATTLSASPIVQTFTYGFVPTEVTSALSVETFNQFFMPGYHLTDVTLQLAITQTLTDAAVTNTSGQTQTFTFTSFANYDVFGTAPDQAALDAAFGFGLTNYTLYSSGGKSVAANSTLQLVPPASGSATTGTGLIHAALLAPYAGNGTFTLSFSTFTSTGIGGGGGNLTAVQHTQAQGVYTVIYQYAADGVPEPATLGLMGSALIGLGLLGFKRLKRS